MKQCWGRAGPGWAQVQTDTGAQEQRPTCVRLRYHRGEQKRATTACQIDESASAPARQPATASSSPSPCLSPPRTQHPAAGGGGLVADDKQLLVLGDARPSPPNILHRFHLKIPLGSCAPLPSPLSFCIY
ncbi:hypothetical protein QYE76_059095 [Lolium multiflorum]|jgi:hypothetical protein|uniref:Uncharacterized protein n=1 Tax=Lolium multiflorum TaxID=4521 RepID=A0AAD8T6M4_LOLMU|nr:hypothetical protein QYE76_059000 [Lolium multiflorum]KAK1670936.1 hypothetical protein QYE76_059095 [Lolium multiflorum]